MRKKPPTMHISEAELVAMTRDLDEMHHDQSLPALKEAVADWSETIRDEQAQQEGIRGIRSNRRTFLIGAGALAAGGVTLAACSSKSTPPTTTTTAAGSGGGTTSTTGGASNDLKVVALATSLENLAVTAYNAGISAATSGKLGSVPQAVPVFATTAKAQHQDHADAWNAILVSANQQKVTGPDPAIAPQVMAGLTQVKTVTDLLTLALGLENTAAQTYQVGSTVVKSQKGIQTAATIHPVEMQHAAILYFVLGKYPGTQDNTGKPLSFNPTGLARPVSDFQGPL